MSTMTNIRAEVWKIVDQDPSIKLDLERGLVNIRALARYCAKLGIDGTENAIISAIRRYPKDNPIKKMYKTAQEMLNSTTFSTRSNIVNIAITKNSDIQELFPKLFACINYERGDTLRIVQGEGFIKIIVDERNLSKILDIIPKKLVLHLQKDLAEINMHLHPEAVKTPGIVLVTSGELTRNGINIYEIMSCVPEMLFFVDDKDLVKAYQILFNLCNSKNKIKS